MCFHRGKKSTKIDMLSWSIYDFNFDGRKTKWSVIERHQVWNELYQKYPFYHSRTLFFLKFNDPDGRPIGEPTPPTVYIYIHTHIFWTNNSAVLPASKSDQSQPQPQHEKVSLILMICWVNIFVQNKICVCCSWHRRFDIGKYWKYGNSQTCGFRPTLRMTCCKPSQTRGDESMQNWASWWSRQRKLRCDGLRTGHTELFFFGAFRFWLASPSIFFTTAENLSISILEWGLGSYLEKAPSYTAYTPRSFELKCAETLGDLPDTSTHCVTLCNLSFFVFHWV